MKAFVYAALVLNCAIATTSTAADHTKDSLQTVRESIAAKKAVLVDVRERDEWDGGHVADAVLLPLSVIEDTKEASAALKRLPKDRILYTHCAAGVRSLKAAELLAKHGYEVRPLKAGYAELLKAGFKNAKPE